jgi:hypothetical protein
MVAMDSGGVLDLPAAHHPGIHPGHHLCRLRPRRMMIDGPL